MNTDGLHFKNVLSGVRWNAIGQVLGQAIRFGVSIVLARLLAPEDFGLLAMVVAITGFLGTFQSLGTLGIVIQTKDLSPLLLNSLYVVNITMGLLLAGLLAVAGPLLATLYGNSQVTLVAQVSGVNFVILSFGLVPKALVHRRMRFDRLVQIEFAASVAQSIVAVILAGLGAKVWALVAGGLAQSIAFSTLYHFSSAQLRLRFCWSEVRNVMRFGLSLTGSHILDHWVANADKLIVGRFLGATLLGYYSQAWSFYTMPITSITNLVNQVMFPALSRIQDDDKQLRQTLLRSTGGIAFVTFPMMAGLGIVAQPAVLSVLGGKWAPIIPLIMIFCPSGIIHSVTGMNGNVLLAKRRSDLLLWWNLGSGAVTVASFLLGLPWGIVGVAAAYSITMIPLCCLSCLITFRLIKLSFVEWLASLRGYAIATAVMASVVFACRLTLENRGYEPPFVLVLSVLAGVTSYISMVLFMRPTALFDFARMLPQIFRSTKLCSVLLASERVSR